jgi:hypothetical protein
VGEEEETMCWLISRDIRVNGGKTMIKLLEGKKMGSRKILDYSLQLVDLRKPSSMREAGVSQAQWDYCQR